MQGFYDIPNGTSIPVLNPKTNSITKLNQALADIYTGGGGANPMTTLGDMIYGGASGTSTRLAGNTTTNKLFLSQQGTGSASAAPVWSAIAFSNITGSVTNAMLAQAPAFTMKGNNTNAAANEADLTVPQIKSMLNYGTQLLPGTITNGADLVSNMEYSATITAATSVLLPISPNNGDIINIVDTSGNFGSFNLSVSPNGNKINGVAASYVLKSNYQIARLIYNSATQNWVITLPQPILARQYAAYALTTSQTTTSVGTVVNMNNPLFPTVGNAITSNGAGAFTLQAGYLYRLAARIPSVSSGNNAILSCQWFNGSTRIGLAGDCVAPTNLNNNGIGSGNEIIAYVDLRGVATAATVSLKINLSQNITNIGLTADNNEFTPYQSGYASCNIEAII